MLHDEIGSNVVWHGVYDYGDIDWALENADHVVQDRPAALPPLLLDPARVQRARSSTGSRAPTRIEIFSNNQMPMFASLVMGPSLRHPRATSSRSRSQDIGGAFGIKIGTYPQITALALLSRKAGPAGEVDRVPHRAHALGAATATSARSSTSRSR